MSDEPQDDEARWLEAGDALDHLDAGTSPLTGGLASEIDALRALRSALQEVPPPPRAIEEQILLALGEAVDANDPSPLGDRTAGDPPVISAPVISLERHRDRRRWLAAAAAVVALAGTVIVIQSTKEPTDEQAGAGAEMQQATESSDGAQAPLRSNEATTGGAAEAPVPELDAAASAPPSTAAALVAPQASRDFGIHPDMNALAGAVETSLGAAGPDALDDLSARVSDEAPASTALALECPTSSDTVILGRASVAGRAVIVVADDRGVAAIESETCVRTAL